MIMTDQSLVNIQWLDSPHGVPQCGDAQAVHADVGAQV